jgi:hypothetical protein
VMIALNARSCARVTLGLSLLCCCVLLAAAETPGVAVKTVATMADLALTDGAEGEVVSLLGYHSVGDGGGGLFVWHPDSVGEHNGGTIVAVANLPAGRWVRVADDVKVTYFGARGDGETDDTAAIQAAIDSVSSTASPGVIFEDHRAVGGTVHFPAGRYRISDTLLVGPNTALTGVGSALGFQRRTVVERDHGSVIVASFEDPEKWIISSAVYYRAGDNEGELVPYRAIISGRSYDAGEHSRANGIQIRDLLVIGEPNADELPPYGGIRLQACPGSVLQGVGVFGVDVAYMLNAGWGLAMRDCVSGSYLYGLLALYNVNGLHIDNCYINGQRSERVIDEGNVAPGNLSDRGRGGQMPEDYPFKKTGILSHYGHSITLNNVITEHWDIARFHVHGQISDTGSWLEGNRDEGYALVTTHLDLRNPRSYQPSMTGEGRFLRAGTNVRATIGTSPAFPITWGSAEANSIVVLDADPDRNGWKHYPAVVSYAHRRSGYVRVAGDDDEAVDNTRIADTTARVDLATALERVRVSDQTDWTISIAAGATCSIPRRVNLGDRTVRFVAEGGGERPVVRLTPGSDGRAAVLEFEGGGSCSFAGVDLAVHNPDGVAASDQRGLIVAGGGQFGLALSESTVSLVDADNAPGQAFSLLQSARSPAVIDALFTDVRIESGHSLFVEGADRGSVITCRSVNTTAPSALLDRGQNGWIGDETVVLHSMIAPEG